MSELATDRQWPVWLAPAEPDRADIEGYGGIARYVVPRVLEENFADVFPPGQRGQHGSGEARTAQADREIVERLWERLAVQSVSYSPPPWHPGRGQRIRPPAWLLRPHGSGTCIDFAVLFAAACLNEELDTSLVMLRGPDTGHVGVAVRLGVAPGQAIAPPFGAVRTATAGVSRIVDAAELCSDESLLLIDVTAAAGGHHDKSLAAAVGKLHTLLNGGDFPYLHLVDIGVRQRAGDEPLEYQPGRGDSLIAGNSLPSPRTSPLTATNTASDATSRRLKISSRRALLIGGLSVLVLAGIIAAISLPSLGPRTGHGKAAAGPPPAPVIPGSISATALGQFRIRVTWREEPPADATGFHIDNGCPVGSCSATDSSLSQTVEHATSATFKVTPGSYQCFRVQAFSSSGVSAWSGYGCTQTPGVTISATREWTPTGVFLQAGQVVGIMGFGTIHTGSSHPRGPAGDRACTPAGNYPATADKFPAPDLPCWSLIARIGGGRPFEVGTSTVIVASPGQLYLGVNSGGFSHNSGSWSVNIKLGGSGPTVG